MEGMRIVTLVPICLGSLFIGVGGASAQPLIDLTGRVALLDGTAVGGTRATLGMDLDRDGTLNSFEEVDFAIAEDGSYAVSYTPDPTDVDLEFITFVAGLAAAYEQQGFEAILADGPLPIIVKIEREGYSTIIKRFTTLSQTPTLDAVLSPLATIGCSDGACAAGDGSVHLSGFPGGTGIDRAYASAYDPSLDTRVFPGAFTDTQQNLLISSGFAEINLHSSSGADVTQISSPISVRFRANEESWANLRDLSEDSGSIEVPMYSFDEARADWVTEPNGELQDAEGGTIPEEDFPSILDGSYPDPVFIAFETRHFSTFNCDAPVNERGCVKGRLVDENGDGIPSVQVNVQGVTYTGSAGAVVTGADGYFAVDVMKSETSSEDVDRNGTRGETFEAQVVISGGLGFYVGGAFETPTVQGTVGGSIQCRPQDCECLDLGDIVPTFEVPRTCSVTVNVSFSGESLFGPDGPLEAGDPVVGATLTGQLTGAVGGPADPAICGGEPCGYASIDASGEATFIVPVIGDEPEIQLKADLTTSADGAVHFYSGSVTIPACLRGEAEVSGTVDLEIGHSSLGDLGGFIASLGGPPSGSGGSGSGGSSSSGGTFPFGDAGDSGDDSTTAGPGCGCRTTPSSPSGGALAVLLGLIAAARRRRSARA
jgi:MYXO-CTERM domain-containing protein